MHAQGSQLGVQVIACYAGAAAALQLLCHLADERRLALMSAAARIEMRLGACSALLGMFAVVSGWQQQQGTWGVQSRCARHACRLCTGTFVD